MAEKLKTMSVEEIIAWGHRLDGWRYFVVGLVGLGLAAMEIITSQTPGKMALKLRVQSETGAPATRDQMIRRSALKYGSYVFMVIGGLLASSTIAGLGGLVSLVFIVGAFMALRPSLQGLHDQLDKTAVYGAAVPGAVPMGFQPVMPGQPMPPAGTPVTPPPATTMPPPPQA